MSMNHHRTPLTRGAIAALLLLGALTSTVGCDESVDPIIGTDLPFTVWGFMNAGADTQRVRVYPITGELRPDGSNGIDAEVFSIDLSTGERREWTYKAVRFDSLNIGHIFWSPFRAEHGHRYRLEVVRSDGQTSAAEVEVPPPVSIDLDIQEGSTLIPVRIEGDVPNLVGIHVTYHAQNIPPASVWPGDQSPPPPVHHSITIPYDEMVERVGGAWELTVAMNQDYPVLKALYRLSCLITADDGSAPDLWLNAMELTAVAADSTWNPPNGVFDPDILAVPGTFSNVENGHGFFGAGHGIRHRWTPSVNAREAAGFSFEPRCSGFATDRLECLDPPVPCFGREVRNLWEIYLQ